MKAKASADSLILSVCEQLDIGCDGLFVVDFIGKSNIWIDNVDEGTSVILARHIVCKALAHTAPGKSSILGYLSGVRCL